MAIQSTRKNPQPTEPQAVKGHHPDFHHDPFAPLPLPEVFEDDSEAAWERWLHAAKEQENTHEQTMRMELRAE